MPGRGRDALSTSPKDIADLRRHCRYLTACISGRSVQSTYDKLIDYRYFYVQDDVGKYACGIAREAAARQLRCFGIDKFGDKNFLIALDDYIGNPSVTGFFIEQAVLSSIASRGLNVSKEISGPMTIVMFAEKYPIFDKDISEAVLYCPLKFNYGGIDGIIVRFDHSEGKCFMFPLQVTVAKSHSDSEEVFFSEWSGWTKYLDGFEIVPEFLWITPEGPSTKNVDENSRSTRSGNRSIWPSYTSQNVPLSKVNQDIWECYERALEKKKKG